MNAFPPRGDWPTDPTAAEWAQQLGLKKRGARSYAGPCPLCGGRDRFHVTERPGRALIGCRGCIDGLPAGARAQRFGELRQAVWPAGGQGRPWRSPLDAKAPARSRPAPAASPDPSKPTAAEIWNGAGTANVAPVQSYILRRGLWDPLFPLPEALRWNPAPSILRRTGAPVGAAGLLVAAYTGTAGNLGAVEIEALTDTGERLKERDGRTWRRTYGSKASSACRIPAPGMLPGGHLVNVCEGLADALAIATQSGCDALAAGGTGNLASLAPELIAERQKIKRKIKIYADGDGGGRRAARKLRQELRADGKDCALYRCPEGKDPASLTADEWEKAGAYRDRDDRDDWEERAAIQQFDGDEPPDCPQTISEEEQAEP